MCKHTHVVVAIYYRGKPDSLYMECSCGEMEIWAEWKRYENWEITPKLQKAFIAFLEAYHSGDTQIYPSANKEE